MAEDLKQWPKPWVTELIEEIKKHKKTLAASDSEDSFDIDPRDTPESHGLDFPGDSPA